MIDRYVSGHIATCQDDCPKFVQESIVEVPGGAANAQRCLDNWRVRTSLYGYATADCPIKTRYMTDRIVFRSDEERPHLRGDYDWAREMAADMVSCASAVLLSDYDKGFLTPKFIVEIAELCKQRGIPCVADAKREPHIYRGTILKCNLDYGKRHPKWWETHDANYVQTLGQDRPACRWGGYEDTDVCGEILPSVKCINHVGAGDCFAAHLTLALAYNFSLKEAAALAHSAGRVYVQAPHNQPPAPADVAGDLDSICTSTP